MCSSDWVLETAVSVVHCTVYDTTLERGSSVGCARRSTSRSTQQAGAFKTLEADSPHRPVARVL